MVDCPVCGEPLVKDGSKSKYFCENESCSVIFVRCPCDPARMRVAFKAPAMEETIAKIEKITAWKTSHIF